jgi:hypothetical protein
MLLRSVPSCQSSVYLTRNDFGQPRRGQLSAARYRPPAHAPLLRSARYMDTAPARLSAASSSRPTGLSPEKTSAAKAAASARRLHTVVR